MSNRRRRALRVGAIASWVVIALVGVSWALLIEFLDFAYCESEVGDSNFGELSWSVVPPGPVCTWTVESNGFAGTSGPTPVMSIWLLALVALGWLSVRLRRVTQRDPGPERRDATPVPT